MWYSHINGTVISDPVEKQYKGGKLANFNMKVPNNDKGDSTFMQVTAWNNQATLVMNGVRKGDDLTLRGKQQKPSLYGNPTRIGLNVWLDDFSLVIDLETKIKKESAPEVEIKQEMLPEEDTSAKNTFEGQSS